MSLADHALVLQSLTESERLLFQLELNGCQKNTMIGVLFALVLGGVGAHHFYLGKTGLGVLYILCCWTFIPAIIAIVECFLMPSRVRRHNTIVAAGIAKKLQTLRSTGD